MRIQPFTLDMLPELVAVYNGAVAHVPHCHRVSRADFRHELEPAVSGAPSETRRDETVFVAVHGGDIIGFVHVAIGPPRPGKDPDEIGLIRFLWYRPGRRDAGAALLDAAEEHCAAAGMTSVYAYPQKHRYPFYHFKAAYLSDRLGHVVALLGLRGYQRVAGEVFMERPNFSIDEPASPPLGAEISVEQIAGRGRLPGVTVYAFQGGRQIGICENASAGEFSRIGAVQDWLFTFWLGVEEEYQGQGLGRWLLQRALWEAQRMGYRHAAISTAWDNYRALIFYTNFGYQIFDWTYGYSRTIGQDTAREAKS